MAFGLQREALATYGHRLTEMLTTRSAYMENRPDISYKADNSRTFDFSLFHNFHLGSIGSAGPMYRRWIEI
jgi:hypothetical protein